MWFQLAASLDNPDDIFDLRPEAIADYLERVWANGSSLWIDSATAPAGVWPPARVTRGTTSAMGWHHLIYAYFVENTRVYEVFRRVLYEYVHGERLGAPDPRAYNWLRVTEALFYRRPPFDAIYAVQSDIRENGQAIRRNAYYRMFGMDLGHGTDDNEPVTYVKPLTANREFASLFEDMLRHLWVGYTNHTNSSGANATDNNAIQRLATQIGGMLRLRRRGWMLAREEFWAVAMMRWFHFTLSYDSPIVQSLQASVAAGGVPSDRLVRIADRVGLKIPSHAREYFDLSEPTSRLLHALEQGVYDETAAVPRLYTLDTPAAEDALTIIDRWSTATNRQLRTAVPQVAQSR